MQIADLQGPWVLELHVPDRHAGHVLAAQREAGNDLNVEFILATDPETTFAGRIERVAETTGNDEVHGPSVLVTVSLDERDERANRRHAPRRDGHRPHRLWPAVAGLHLVPRPDRRGVHVDLVLSNHE